ncbi:MAG: M23 family metallopeptidase [Bacteroidales bacterium]|nr:M23 family metallopeptidase [Bacteroidales bacterium]
MPHRTEKKKSFFHKLHDKYRLVLMNDDTFEEKLSFRLTRFNVFIFFGAVTIFLVVATTYLIAFTPLREYIPGYGDFNTRKVLRELTLRADSLETSLRQKDLYIMNIRNIVEGREILDHIPDSLADLTSYEIESLPRSREDSILRAEMESLGGYAISLAGADINPNSNINQFFFFPPMKGIITNHFDPLRGHFGIDLVSDPNEAIKSTLDGTVIFSGWTLETGYTISIQHSINLVSAYKHNSVLLKQAGDVVKAGEVIAIIGDSGILSTGPHLHFELWFNGNPVNPVDYIIF